MSFIFPLLQLLPEFLLQERSECVARGARGCRDRENVEVAIDATAHRPGVVVRMNISHTDDGGHGVPRGRRVLKSRLRVGAEDGTAPHGAAGPVVRVAGDSLTALFGECETQCVREMTYDVDHVGHEQAVVHHDGADVAVVPQDVREATVVNMAGRANNGPLRVARNLHNGTTSNGRGRDRAVHKGNGGDGPSEGHRGNGAASANVEHLRRAGAVCIARGDTRCAAVHAEADGTGHERPRLHRRVVGKTDDVERGVADHYDRLRAVEANCGDVPSQLGDGVRLTFHCAHNIETRRSSYGNNTRVGAQSNARHIRECVSGHHAAHRHEGVDVQNTGAVPGREGVRLRRHALVGNDVHR
eukprot:PhM_4_TR13500/c0_g1_i1/m.24433